MNMSKNRAARGDAQNDSLESSDEEGGQASDSMNSLISFSNLEAVVKHVMEKFKKVEDRLESFDKSFAEIRGGLNFASRERKHLEEREDEIEEKLMRIQESTDERQDGMPRILEDLEKVTIFNKTLEKKLENVYKEKVLQDKLIKDMHETLQSKVSITELNMFEARFAGYSTKADLQQIYVMLFEYTKAEQTERLVQMIKSFENKFDDYMRSSEIHEYIQQIRDWLESELGQYARAQRTEQMLDQFKLNLDEYLTVQEKQVDSIEKEFADLRKKLSEISEIMSENFSMVTKAEETEELMGRMDDFVSRDWAEKFERDCVQKLVYCMTSASTLDERCKATDLAIERLDKAMLDKSTKYDIVVVNAKVDQCMNRQQAIRELQTINEKVEFVSGKVEHYVNTESERLIGYRLYDQQLSDITTSVEAKADRLELLELGAQKPDIAAFDEVKEAKELTQRQLEYLAITIYGLSKFLSDPKPNDKPNVRKRQKTQLVMQAEALWHWIVHNEAPGNLRPQPVAAGDDDEPLAPPPPSGSGGNRPAPGMSRTPHGAAGMPYGGGGVDRPSAMPRGSLMPPGIGITEPSGGGGLGVGGGGLAVGGGGLGHAGPDTRGSRFPGNDLRGSALSAKDGAQKNVAEVQKSLLSSFLNDTVEDTKSQIGVQLSQGDFPFGLGLQTKTTGDEAVPRPSKVPPGTGPKLMTGPVVPKTRAPVAPSAPTVPQMQRNRAGSRRESLKNDILPK